jgi:hypothetical protein
VLLDTLVGLNPFLVGVLFELRRRVGLSVPFLPLEKYLVILVRKVVDSTIVGWRLGLYSAALLEAAVTPGVAAAEACSQG